MLSYFKMVKLWNIARAKQISFRRFSITAAAMDYVITSNPVNCPIYLKHPTNKVIYQTIYVLCIITPFVSLSDFFRPDQLTAQQRYNNYIDKNYILCRAFKLMTFHTVVNLFINR